MGLRREQTGVARGGAEGSGSGDEGRRREIREKSGGRTKRKREERGEYGQRKSEWLKGLGVRTHEPGGRGSSGAAEAGRSRTFSAAVACARPASNARLAAL
eukprot:2333274-Pleurochrysis_carterae.AAC.1